MIDTLTYYLKFPFVQYAIIVGVLIALCSSLLGVTLVLKRFSFIGDGLSHVAFGAMAIASIINLTNDMLLVMPITIISAVLLLWTGQNAKIKGDAAIAMMLNDAPKMVHRICLFVLCYCYTACAAFQKINRRLYLVCLCNRSYNSLFLFL